MTDDRPPDSANKPATASGPVAEEVAKWLRTVRLGWTQPLEKPLSLWERRFYGCAGALTWLVGLVLFSAVTEPRFANFVFSGVVVNVLAVVIPIVTFWFGWLFAFVDRPSSPIRLFLDGLLLPAATLVIIGLSMGRVPSTPEPESGPVSLQPPNSTEAGAGSASEEPRADGDPTSGTPFPSDGGRQ